MSPFKQVNQKQIRQSKVLVFGTFDIFHEGHKNFLKQAREYGNYLIVVVARDKTVEEVKKRLPRNDENSRLENIKKSGLADEAVLGSLENKYNAIEKYNPAVICLGYDQEAFTENLREKLEEFGLGKTKIVRLKSYQAEKYKSSKLRKIMFEVIQHKNFRIKSLKYKADKNNSRRVLELREKFNKKFNWDEQKKLAFSRKVDFIYDTTTLEGNTYTYAETETLLSGVTIGGHSLKEENEILNQKEAWKFTLDKSFPKPPVETSESLIKDIHLLVGKDTVVKPGQYRDGRVKIGGTDYIPPKTKKEIENQMKNFLADFNNLQEEIYLKAIILHFVIALVQPFYDGNKRTARLMMNFLLLQNNYPLFSVPAKIRKEYVDAMIKGYESLDISELVELLEKLMIEDLEGMV